MPPSEAPPGHLKLRRIWYALGLLMLIVVAVVSLMPLMPLSDIGVSDKFSHLLTYFLLAGWFGLLARNVPMLAGTLAGLIVYGMLMELLQSLTGYRFAEWGDVVANSIGALAGVTLYFTPLRRLFRLVDNRFATLL